MLPHLYNHNVTLIKLVFSIPADPLLSSVVLLKKQKKKKKNYKTIISIAQNVSQKVDKKP
jgi:hypothetical protein